MNEEVNRNNVNRNKHRKNEDDTKRRIKRTARFSMNEESSIKKENKNMQ